MNDSTPNFEEDEAIGLRLKDHLRAELEPYVGGATAKLDAELQTSMQIGRPQSVLRIGLRWSAAAMLLLGLGVALPLIASRSNRKPTAAPTIAINDHSKPPADAIVTSWSETVDAGTVLVDPETPARMLKRTRYEKAEWRDAAGQWQSVVTKPDEDVILVDLQKQ